MWDRGREVGSPSFLMQNFCGPLLPGTEEERARTISNLSKLIIIACEEGEAGDEATVQSLWPCHPSQQAFKCKSTLGSER